MPRRNQELARRGLDAFSSGDLEQSLATMDPEVEWHVAFQLPDLPPDTTVVRGHEGVRRLWNAFRSGFEEVTVDLEEVVYDAGDVLIARVRFRARGAGSGIEVDRRLYYLQRIRDERLKLIRPFDTLEEARAAAGLDA